MEVYYPTDKFDESQAETEKTTLHHPFSNNHDVAAIKDENKGQLALEHIFGFCKTLTKISKQLGFHLTFKTVELEDIIYTTIGDNFKVNLDKSFFYVRIVLPDAQTQIMFNDSIKNSFTLSFDSWSTDRETADTQIEYQVDMGCSQNFNSPNYLTLADQTAAGIGVPNKANKFAVSDNLIVRKYLVDIDGIRYPRDGVSIDYAKNDYLDQDRDLKLFHNEYLGERLIQSFIIYTDMKNKYPIQVIDLRFQVDRINPKKIQLFEGYRSANNNATLFMIPIGHREIKMNSDGNKITEVSFIQNDKTYF